MTTQILHTADTHIGYRQYHQPEREEDFRKAFEAVVDAAIERDVDAVVHGGDIFNRSRPSIGALSDVVEQLKRLRDADIPFCTIVGNHDGTRDRQWPEFFQDIGLGVYLDGTGYVVGDVTLYGQDYVDDGHRDALEYEFDLADTEHAALVAHGLFTPFPHGTWDSYRLLDKSTVPFDALLLGDDHKPQRDTVNGIPITYPGSTERTAADQRDTRGYNIITFNGDITINRETIETRDFRYIDVELEPDHDIQHVLDRVTEATIPDNSIVIVTLTGSGKRVAPAEIEQAGLRDGALVVRVNDRRDFDDSDAEFENVTMSDPDDLIRDRKRELGLSRVGSELEDLARDVDELPKSSLKDTAETRVDNTISEEPNDVFETQDTDDTPDTDTPTSDPGESDTDDASSDNESPETDAATETSDDNPAEQSQPSSGQMRLEDL